MTKDPGGCRLRRPPRRGKLTEHVAERDEVIALARQRFGDTLTPSETKVIEDAALGNTTELGRDDPAGAAGWPADRVLRTEVVCWLLTSAKVRPLLSTRGVQIVGARLDETLDLSGAEIGVRVYLRSCALKKVLLHDARVESLSLGGSHADSIGAQRLHVRGALFLGRDEVVARGFVCRGKVDLTGAQVDGVLKCSNAHLSYGSDAEQVALSLVRARIGGSLFLDEGFEAQGKIRLTTAKIGGSLVCSGGRLESPNGDAIEADGLDVAHSVCLDKLFESVGAIALADAKVGHNVKCVGGAIRQGTSEYGLNASRIEVAGSVRFEKFELTGKIVLSDADIGGSLVLTELRPAPRFELFRTRIATDVDVAGVRFNAADAGLIARDAKIEGQLRWRNVTAAGSARLDLRGAHVATLDDCPSLWDESGVQAQYDGLTYVWIQQTSLEDVQARIEWFDGRRVRPTPSKHSFSPQPYNQLAATLRNSGHEDLAVKVAMAREDHRRSDGGLSVKGRAWLTVVKAVLGSGYRPGRALLWSLAFVAIGAVVFRVADDRGQFGFLVEKPHLRPAFNPIVYSLDTFLPVSDLQQERFRAPKKGTFARYYLWVHVGVGWVLVTLGLVGVTGLIRRE